MESSYILALVFVVMQLVLVCNAFQEANKSFTIMNYLPKEDFVNLNCDCQDVEGRVTTLVDTIDRCVDKEFPTAACPNGVQAKTFFCNFRYYQRNRAASTISDYYCNIQVWTSPGPARTYYQLHSTGVFGSTTFDYFDPTSQQANLISKWGASFSDYLPILKHASIGNGQFF